MGNTETSLSTAIDATQTLPEGNRNTLPELPEMEDGPDSWFNDPRITEDSRNIRLRARAYRQNNAYRRDPNNFNRREWRQRDEARMIERPPVRVRVMDDDDQMNQDNQDNQDRNMRRITPQSVQAEAENEDATRLEVFERGGQVLLRRNRELPQQRIRIPRIVPPTSQNNRAEPYTLDLDSDSSSDDDTLLPIQPYESDVPSNFARQEI